MDNGASSYRRFLDGDESAFNEIMNDLFRGLVFFIDRYVHDTHAAEDIAIDTFSDLVVHKHKTFISVGEKGTKAGAATVVEMADGAAVEPQEPKEVYLDRPFVYMLIDCENNIPFFIGTMMDVN